MTEISNDDIHKDESKCLALSAMGSPSRPRIYTGVPPISISPIGAIGCTLHAPQAEVGRGKGSEEHARAELFEAST